MASASKAPFVLHTLLGLVVCTVSYSLGRMETPSDNDVALTDSRPPEPTLESSAFQSPSPERLRELISSTQIPHRVIEFKLGVDSLDAPALKELWGFAAAELNFSDTADYEIGSALLCRLATLDPSAALLLIERDGAAWKSQLSRDVVGAWSEINMDSALEWIAEAGSGVRDRALRDVLERLGDRDRSAAVNLFREQVAKGVVGKGAWGAEEFFNEWAKESPTEAIGAALEHFQFTGRDNALGGVIQSWATRDPIAALDWLKASAGDLSNQQQVDLTSKLFACWSNTSPSEAAPVMLTLESDKSFHSASNHVLRDWASIDFHGASEWIATVEDEARRKHLERMLVDGARKDGDRAQAVSYAAEQFETNGGMSHPMYMAVASVIGRDGDYAEKIQWVQDVAPNDHVLEEFYNTLLHQWRGEDVSEAIKHLDLMPDPVRRAEDYQFFARYWANGDLDAAREFANDLPESDDRDRALVGVSAAWAKQEPETALEWIGTLEGGDLRDRIASTYLGTQADNDIPAALELAESLTNPYRSDHSLEFVMGKWLAQDPESAEAAILTHPKLSETSKWRLLNGGNF